MILSLLIGVPVVAALGLLGLRGAVARQLVLVATGLFHVALVALLWSYELPQRAWYDFLRLDAAGLLFLSLASLLFAVAACYGVGYFRVAKHKGALPQRVYDACLLLFLASMTLVVTSNHVGLLWVAVEATTVASAPLVFYHRSHSALEATWKYLIVCSVGIALALLGTFFLAIAATGEGAGASLFVDVLAVPENASRLAAPWLRGAFIFVLVGFGTKMGLAPMHTWLPDAHSEAPSPVSALLSGALLNCAFLGILRMYRVCEAAGQGAFARQLLLVLGLVSVLLAAVFLVGQADYKRMLAYSSVEHMGVLAVGIGLGGLLAHGSVFLHAVNHSLTKGLLFLTAGNLVLAFGSKRVDGVRATLKSLPTTGWLFLLGFLAISGFPPFGLFHSEYGIVRAALATEQAWVAVVLLALLGVAFVGMALNVLPMTQGPREAAGVVQRGPLLTVLAPWVLAAGVMGLGVYLPPRLVQLMQDAAADLVPQAAKVLP